MQEAGAKPARSRHCNRGATLIGHGHGLEGEASGDPRARRLASSRPASLGRCTPERANRHDAFEFPAARLLPSSSKR